MALAGKLDLLSMADKHSMCVWSSNIAAYFAALTAKNGSMSLLALVLVLNQVPAARGFEVSTSSRTSCDTSTVAIAAQPATMGFYGETTKKNGLSKSARAGVIAAVVIVCGIVLLLFGYFLWRNRKLKLTKELAEAQEGVPQWPTKWPSRAKPTATSAQPRNSHGEPVEVAPPAYDLAQPLPTYEAPRSHQDAPESYELANMSHGQRSARQEV